MPDPSPWPLIIGTLSGTALGGGLTWLIEAGRWRRQQNVRWDDRRVDLYARLLGLTDDAVRCAHNLAHAAGPPQPPDLEARTEDLAYRIENLKGLADKTEKVIRLNGNFFLFSKNAVTRAFNACQASLAQLLLLAEDEAATRADWDTAISECEDARGAFVIAARKELGLRWL